MADRKSDVSVDSIIPLVLADAEKKRRSAGMSGSWDDGGASRVAECVAYYRYGRAGVIPPDWERFAEQARNASDPEWANYQRLKEKFGDGHGR